MLQFYSADVPYSVQKFVDLNAAEFILEMIYADALRDEEGGTFGASSRIGLQYNPIERATILVIFDASEANQANLRELAISGLKGLAEKGPTEEQLARAIKKAKGKLPEQRISNSYWLNAFSHNTCLDINYDAELEKAICPGKSKIKCSITIGFSIHHCRLNTTGESPAPKEAF